MQSRKLILKKQRNNCKNVSSNPLKIYLFVSKKCFFLAKMFFCLFVFSRIGVFCVFIFKQGGRHVIILMHDNVIGLT